MESVVARAWRGGREGGYFLMGTEFLLWGEEILEMGALLARRHECA